ncbi:MAG: twitching motility protein PilT [Opitutales bacterium]|nr:twitching motility protein PilT [Opitutales bacterium]MCH8539934.1 twitching motility protein PilT [Opitutales bacterium]
MDRKNILILRIVFLLLCGTSSWLLAHSTGEWDHLRSNFLIGGLLLGGLVILVDILLKGFSLRGLTALTFGLAVGSLVAFLLSASPMFEGFDEESEQMVFLVRLSLFVILSYLGAVIALRGKDEFNLIIPYVRFVPHDVDVPMIILDTSALIDGRIAKIAQTRFLSNAFVIPRFVLNELQSVADSPDPEKKARGRYGLAVLNELRNMDFIDLRIEESSVSDIKNVDAKLVFLARQLRAKLLTIDYNLNKMAEFQEVQCLNINDLVKALTKDWKTGEMLEIVLNKEGREPDQAVGYMPDGAMVVVNDGHEYMGRMVQAKIVNAIPSAAGRMIFANFVKVLD